MGRDVLFADSYKKCWEFFIVSRWYFVFALGIFMLTFLIGFTFPVFFRAGIFKMVEELRLQIVAMGTGKIIGFIFLNNLKASFFAMVLGVFFGIFPLITCVFNGYLLGFVGREVVGIDGISAMWKIFPHGIFELPAIVFAIGIGLRLGVGWINEEDKWGRIKKDFVEGIRFFIFVIFPLLVLAAVIEGLLIGFFR